ncbi:MAG: DUF2304 domain-containing protein [Candidatus Woesearchaeota archaeon]
MAGLISGVQIFGICFGLLMMYLTFLYHKRQELSVGQAAFWFVLWLGFIIVSIVPTVLDFFIGDVLNMARRLDFFIIIGFMVLVGVSFYNYRSTKRVEKRIEEVVRKVALKGARK